MLQLCKDWCRACAFITNVQWLLLIKPSAVSLSNSKATKIKEVTKDNTMKTYKRHKFLQKKTQIIFNWMTCDCTLRHFISASRYPLSDKQLSTLFYRWNYWGLEVSEKQLPHSYGGFNFFSHTLQAELWIMSPNARKKKRCLMSYIKVFSWN